MKCIHCNTENSESSVFCAHCGRRLLKHPEGQPPHPPDVEQLLNDGYNALDAGKNSEALLAVESILRIDALNASAWALKALVHERTGELELAIDAYEELVELNPASTHDRRRLLDLKAKRMQAAHAKPSAPHQPASPFWAAGITVALLMIFMTVFVVIVLRSQPEKANAASHGVDVAMGTPAGQPVPQPQPTVQQQQQPNTQQPSQVGQPLHNSLPSESLGGGDFPIVIRDTGPKDSKDKGAASKSGDGTVVMPDKTDKTDKSDKSGGGAPGDNGDQKQIIEVKVSGSKDQSGSKGPGQPQETSSLLRIARSEEIQGNYKTAVSYYQRALSGTKYTGSIHQEIGVCYYRLGDYANAATSYQSAIDAYRAQVKDSVSVQQAQSGISTCQAGIKACKRD